MPYNNEDIDQLASSYGKEANPDVEAALSAVKQRIKAGTESAVVRQLPQGRRWLGIAATLLLLVSAGYFGFLRNTDVVLANNDQAPMEVQLPDGTDVTLQAGSSISYAYEFNEIDRRVRLKGQAFFAVHKDKDRPFLVRNAETELRVTGTAFNLRVEDEELEVEVSEGAVELRKGTQVVPVKANQCGLSITGEPSVVRPAPHLNRHAWRTGKLYFQDAELAVVLETLRTNFGLIASLEGNCSYAVSGTYSADTPVAILRNVARLGGGDVSPINGKPNNFRITGICD